jgi:hypothetical protein
MIVYADPDQTPTALTLQDNPDTPTSGLTQLPHFTAKNGVKSDFLGRILFSINASIFGSRQIVTNYTESGRR